MSEELLARPVLGPDNLPHHWAQGPLDVWAKRQWYFPKQRVPSLRWGFRYWIQDGVLGVTRESLSKRVDLVLNHHPRSWRRAGVDFIEVTQHQDAEIVLRFSDAPPIDWPNMTGFLGLYYHDRHSGKNVAQVTPSRQYFDDPTSLAYILGMELAGHGCFRMHDGYLHGHEPYKGAMGGWEEAKQSLGFPTDLEIQSAKAWLKGEAFFVHGHNVVVPEADIIHALYEADARVHYH